MEGAPPETRRPATTPKARPKQEAVGARRRELLAESVSWTAGKQRVTAARLHGLLTAEGFEVGLTLVRALVAEHRRQRQEVFVPLTDHPGDLCEVDFFEVQVDLPAGRRKAWMLVARLIYSGRDFAWLFPRQDQVCFLDGLTRAFAHFGGVPQRGLFDNLKPAVRRILVGSDRLLSPRFAAFVAHHAGFEPCFARPGEGHDKGGVEARGRGIRLQELVPIPKGDDLTSISSALLARLDARADVARFAEERGAAGVILYTDPGDAGFAKGKVWPEGGGWANDNCLQRGTLNTLPYPGDPGTPGQFSSDNVQRDDPARLDLPRIPVQPIGYGAAGTLLSRFHGAEVPEAWRGGLTMP